MTSEFSHMEVLSDFDKCSLGRVVGISRIGEGLVAKWKRKIYF